MSAISNSMSDESQYYLDGFDLGTVRWFDPERRFGFINPDRDEQADVFLHWSALKHPNHQRLLTDNVRVAFHTRLNPRRHDGGLEARNVIVINGEDHE